MKPTPSLPSIPLMSAAVLETSGGGGGAAIVSTPASIAPGPPPSSTSPSSPAAQPSATRPEYIPEKYWRDGQADVETLGRSYQELERKFHSRHPAVADTPADPTGYTLDPERAPEGIAWTPGMAGDFASVFHAHGITNTAGKALVSAYLEREEAMLTAASEAYEAKLDQDKRTLEREWGGPVRYQEKLSQVAGFVTSLGYGTDNARLFSDPEIVGFLGKVVGMLGEDAKAAIKGSVAPGGHFTLGRDEAERIMKDSSHPDHESYLRGDHGVVSRVKRLIDGE